MFATLLKQELSLGIRQRNDIILLLTFTLLSALLFPIALGPEPQLLSRMGPGIIWVLILFAAHLASPHVWRQDIEDGTCEQLLHLNTPPEWLVLSKTLSVWIQYFACLLLLTPLLSLLFSMDNSNTIALLISLTIASLPLSCLTVTSGLLTLDTNRSAILATVITLPLYLPVLIFSCAACDSITSLMMLAGISLFYCPILLYANMVVLKWVVTT